MWFILRSAFCVGLVFSMAPGEASLGGILDAPVVTLASIAAPAMRGGLAACGSEPRPCLEAARRFAIDGGGSASPAPKANGQAGVRIIADTLTAADRALAWRGPAKAPFMPRRPPFHLEQAGGVAGEARIKIVGDQLRQFARR